MLEKILYKEFKGVVTSKKIANCLFGSFLFYEITNNIKNKNLMGYFNEDEDLSLTPGDFITVYVSRFGTHSSDNFVLRKRGKREIKHTLYKIKKYKLN